ncbi:MAG TPA: ethylbenzene dehydrogenase-related protein [Afifellaceae bacterium]|nr:ethylbenzene dehydrogenase-related protein [Afifellaceae bacterium]
MVDVTNGGDSTGSRVAADAPSARGIGVKRASRSDIGTVIIHWVSAIAMFVSIATGLRIASDALNAPISQFLSPILPQGEVWTVHFIAGLVLFFASIAYLVYVRRSGLNRRSAPKRIVVLTMPAAPRLKWAAINVILHWALFALVTVMTVTGVLLYLGYGGLVVRIHTIAAFAVISYIVFHLISHFNYGGIDELLRIFRPARLVENRSVKSKPLLIAFAIAIPAAAGVAGLDWATRDTLYVAPVTDAPVTDGRIDDASWSSARPVTVHTQQGEALGGTGASTVEIRAVRDAQNIYFAFRWNDPTRSIRRMPLVKREDGWHVLQDHADRADVNTYYEDKFAVAFSRSPAFGGGDSTHLGSKPLDGQPASYHGRGLHYTTDGSYIDMWQWKSTRGGLLGMLDDMVFGPPLEGNEAQWNGKSRYKAGYVSDPGTPAYKENYKVDSDLGYDAPVKVPRLPKDLAATQAAMGPYEMDPDESLPEDAVWWMTEENSIPYSAEADAAIPVGTIIPGLIIVGKYIGDRADVTGGVRWEDGYWTLETKRKLVSDSKYDVSFDGSEPLYVWVSVFDHTQIRHTRHQRPVRLLLGN